MLSVCQYMIFTIGKNPAEMTAIMGLSRPYGRGGLSVPVHPHERYSPVSEDGPHLHGVGGTDIPNETISILHRCPPRLFDRNVDV